MLIVTVVAFVHFLGELHKFGSDPGSREGPLGVAVDRFVDGQNPIAGI